EVDTGQGARFCQRQAPPLPGGQEVLDADVEPVAVCAHVFTLEGEDRSAARVEAGDERQGADDRTLREEVCGTEFVVRAGQVGRVAGRPAPELPLGAVNKVADGIEGAG